jgi:hypothetical protein
MKREVDMAHSKSPEALSVAVVRSDHCDRTACLLQRRDEIST